MNRRRMMMGRGKTEPLLVFEYGKSALSNGRMTSGYGAAFLEGKIKINNANGNSGYMNIGGIDFSGYKKLKIECYTDVLDYEIQREYHYCGYGKDEGSEKSDYTSFKYIPSSAETLEFDIGATEGENFIKACANSGMTIKNIRLE
ncbi:MAG: hypothetical protein IKJ82_02485 [Oscillospiraceae bacterium]|nr:hypothetical protein [Oscillospiraceae bacterium]